MAAECTTSDGIDLFLHDWTFEDPRAVVAIVHGYAEHGGRYEHVAGALRSAGLASLAVDLRGHGRSPGARGDVKRFADYHLDVDALVATARRRAPGRPVHLFAHSMGGLIVLDRMRTAPLDAAERVVLSSPLLALHAPLSRGSRLLVRALELLWPRFPLPTRLEGARVCRDEVLRRDHDDDPLVLSHTTARWIAEAHRAMTAVRDWRPGPLPALLVLSAGDDRVVDAATSRAFAEHAGARHVEIPGAYHELVNEPPATRARVLERLVAWISQADPPHHRPEPGGLP